MTDYDQRVAALLRRQRELIDLCGRAISYVFDPDGVSAPYGYTIGLTEHGDGCPEFILTGLDIELTSIFLNSMAERVLSRGQRFAHGQTVDDLVAERSVLIVAGPATDALHPGALYSHYGDAFTLQQVVWPDPAGRFPWDDGYTLPDTVQPLLGRP